jgi:hypothetical protein
MRSLEELVRGLGLGRDVLGMFDEFFGAVFEKGDEVLASQSQFAIGKLVEDGVLVKGKIALEDHAVVAVEDG